MKMKLTASALAAIKAPSVGRLTVHDTATPGLCVRITAANARTFYTCRWNRTEGKLVWVKLGDVKDLTIDQAKARAKHENVSIGAGENPNEERRKSREAAKNAPTLEGLWGSYLEHLNNDCKPKTIKEFERLYNAHLKPWAKREPMSITAANVRELKASIGKKSEATANRVLIMLTAIYHIEAAKDYGVQDGFNPASGIQRFKETPRARVLTTEEINRLIKALDAEKSEVIRDYFLMCLHTGARRNNVARMRFDAITKNVFNNETTWKIAAHDSKSGKPLNIPLTPKAVAVLERRKANNHASTPYVFPSRLLTHEQVAEAQALYAAGKNAEEIARIIKTSGPSARRAVKPGFVSRDAMPYTGAGNQWAKILKRAGLEDVHIHDLRRTFCTRLLESGADLPTVAAAAGHSSIQTTAKFYTVARMERVAAATTKAEAGLEMELQAMKNAG